MKNLVSILSFALVFLFSMNINGQTKKTGPIKFDPVNSIHLEIPDSYRPFPDKLTTNENEYRIINEYNEKLKGEISVSFDNNNNVVSIFVPKSSGLSEKALVNSSIVNRAPHRNCEDKPSNWGVILCMYNNVVDSIFALFN